MHFGMPTLIEFNDLEENAALCHELGLDFIELNMNFPQYGLDALEQTQLFKTIAEHYHIYYTIHLDENLNVCDFNRTVSNAYLDTVRKTIDIAKQLHAPVINMHMNHGVYVTLPDRKVQLFEKYKEHYMKGIKELLELCNSSCEGTDIKISIENTDGFQDYEKTAIEYLLRSNVFTMTWDIGHSHASGNADEGFIIEHAGKLKHFHIHDAAGKSNHLTLGSGDIDLENRIMLAEKCGARCVIETKTAEALKQSLIWLHTKELR